MGVPIWVSIHTSLCLLLSSPFSLSPSSEMTLLTQVMPSSSSPRVSPRSPSWAVPRVCLPSSSSLPRLARPPPLVCPSCLPSSRLSLDQAVSNNFPSFLPPWLQGLAGSLPATGRADTAAVEGTEDVAAKEEELNNAMVEYLKACYSSGYSYPSSSYTSGYSTGYPT